MAYTAKDITVLEGLEPVRKRPGMYIGGVGAPGYHHLLWEIVDNAVDEVINAYLGAHHDAPLTAEEEEQQLEAAEAELLEEIRETEQEPSQ